MSDNEICTVRALHDRFREAGVRRACIVVRDGDYRLFVDRQEPQAPPLLPVLKQYLPPPGEWEHEAIFIGRPLREHPKNDREVDSEIDTLFFAFVHDTQRGLAQGGLRLRDYARDYTETEALKKLFEDGLRLAEGMTMKNAMADLWWGGGKGIIAETPELASKIWPLKQDGDPDRTRLTEESFYPPERERLFEAYGHFVSEIGGIYYTAADMNTYGVDMLRVLRGTRFVTCLPKTAGGSADPSPVTAEGVFRAIKAAWQILEGTDSLRNVRVAVQGAGKVGQPLVMYLLADGAEVWVGDKTGDEGKKALATVLHMAEEAPGVDPARLHLIFAADDPDVILRQEVDVISPCAAGQTVNRESILAFSDRVQLVCGAANNMLGDEDADAALLHEKRKCYVPDFVCNRMGIVNCADEWMGFLADDSHAEVERVVADVERIVRAWNEDKTPTLDTARQMAFQRLAIPNPLERMKQRTHKLLEHYLEQVVTVEGR
ncbi:MAG TPA: Glu/Leu/Phe/Val dehydrogenase dimerization domain-containing protein [Longimicrobiaceae bacterium]|nr:Glu/Leu/Phe/Val dehydrogenase dimerization domain-containing protein [Longimicrobiaceae bacterium]